MDFKEKSHPNSTDGTDDDWPTCHRLEWAPACSLNLWSLPALWLPVAFQPKANCSSSKVTLVTDAGGRNSLNLRTPNICGIGYAQHSDAHVTKTMNPCHANTSLVVNTYAPDGHELAHHQSELPSGKYKLPGAIVSHFRSQAIKIKTVCPVRFSHCLGKKRGRNNRETGFHPGSSLQERFSPKTSSISVSVLSQKGTVPDLELFKNDFFFTSQCFKHQRFHVLVSNNPLYIFIYIYIYI